MFKIKFTFENNLNVIFSLNHNKKPNHLFFQVFFNIHYTFFSFDCISTIYIYLNFLLNRERHTKQISVLILQNMHRNYC